MTRATRAVLTAATLGVTIFTTAAVAQAASAPSGVQPGANCGNTSSAINQYCEDVPSASGGGSGPPGTQGATGPQLGTGLPPAAVRALKRLPDRVRNRARKLLSLPAPGASVPVSGSISSHTSAWALPIGVILAMVAIAGACVAAAVVGRRRRRGGRASEV
jgi:hypothetical protein